jgi:hypothetical protein
MQAVCDTLEQLVNEGTLKQYAIGVSTAAGFHGELINRGKILRLIDSERDLNLKQLLVRNWTIVMSRKTK